jgi:hypothetical protein
MEATELKNVVYSDDDGIKVRKVNSFLGACFIIHDTIKGTNVEIMGLQFAAMVKRVISKDQDYGSFPHGGFNITEDSVIIYHDGDRSKHEVVLTIDKLKEITNSIL